MIEPNAEREIHSVHPYPCKFPGWSVTPYLDCDGRVILDPFCGSGTTLFEAAVKGWQNVIGFDSNPIATLITRFKLMRTEPSFFSVADSKMADLAVTALSHIDPIKFDFDGRDHWFDATTLSELARIVAWIRAEPRSDVREWLTISLSRIVNRVSRQESETRYVAVDKDAPRGETMRRFIDSCATTVAMLKAREPINAEVRIECADVRTRLPLGDATVDRIITSPPYANSMDYYLYHKQRMNILGYNFKAAQNTEIGSRHEFSSLKAPAEKWKRDYAAVLAEFRRVLRPGGLAVIIIGDSQIAGEKIDAAHLTEAIAGSIGFESEVLDSTSLDGRSRSFSRGFQRPNKMEHTVRLTAPRGAPLRRGVDLPEVPARGEGGVLRVAR